ncbi:uncharacterized protein LOC108875889 [Lates japonicus]
MWCAIMGFVHVAVAVLGLLSVGQSAPLTSCKSLTQPLEIQGRDHLLGKWIFIAESTNITGSRLLTKKFVDSAWSKITAANESDAINNYQAQKMFGRCFSISTKATVENSTLSMVHPYAASTILLNTACTDCLVFYSKFTTGSSIYAGVQLLSKRSNVSADELQEFMKQVECLNLPAPAILDPEKGFCPDESLSQETENTDLTNFMNDMGSEVLNLMENIVGSDGGLKMLMKLVSSGISGLKQN